VNLERTHTGILVGAVLASIGIAYSGPRQGSVPGLFLLMAVVIALAPLFLNLIEQTTPGSWARHATLFGLAWFGLNPSNTEIVGSAVHWRVICSVLGMIAGLVVYQCRPGWRRLGFFLAPVLAAALCHRMTLAFAPLLFIYIFLFEEDGKWPAIPLSVARSAPAFIVSLTALLLDAGPAVPLTTIMEAGGRNLLGFLAPWTAAQSTAAPATDASLIAAIFVAGLAGYTATSRNTRAVSFGLWWFLLLTFMAPFEPLAASIGLALAGAAAVARAGVTLAGSDLRLVGAGCLCLLLLCGAGIMQRNSQAFLLRPGGNAQLQALMPAQPPSGSQPGSAEQYLNVSLSLFQARRFEESIAAAQSALRIQPNYPEAYNNIAAASSELKQWDRAIEAAQQALRLNPSFALARNNLVWALDQKRLQSQNH